MITTKFVRQFEGLVKTVAHDYEKDPDKFEDLVQDIWLQICRKAKLLPKDEKAYSTWVQVVAENVCKHHIKAEGQTVEFVNDSALTPTSTEDDVVEGSWIENTIPSQSTAEDDVLLDEFIMRAATLSEQENAVFNLVYWHGWSYEAVAKKFGITVEHVGVVVTNLRDKLEVKELYHSAPVYHSPGTVWADWSYQKDGEGNKRMGGDRYAERPDLVLRKKPA